METDPDVRISGTYKDYHTLLTKKAKISPKHTAKLQGKIHSSYKQGQRIFPVQSRRFSLSNLTFNHSIKNNSKESINKICWSISNL